MTIPQSTIDRWTTQLEHLHAPLSNYEGLQTVAGQFCRAAVERYFINHGIFTSASEWSFDSICRVLRIVPPYHKFIRTLLRLLVDEGAVEQSGDYWRKSTSSPNGLTVEHTLAKMTLFQPAFVPFFSLLETVVRSYPRVLSGELPSSALLYPQGDASTLERLHAITPPVGSETLCLSLAHNTIRHLAEQYNRPLNVLEVGGGQGVLTDAVVDLCGSCISRYEFTDISRSLVMEAARKYGSLSQISCSVFDITQPAPFEPGAFDLVLSYNVVHAVAHLPKTLKALSTLLATGGSMLHLEMVSCPPWIELLYGITREWHSYDDESRTLSPLLPEGAWTELVQRTFSSPPILFPKIPYADTMCILITP